MKIPTEHRPWPAPDRPWAMAMRWHDLMFMHWPVPAAALRPLIPRRLDLDTFDGHAWLGVVPFRMTGVRPRLVPPVPGMSAFPELNVRTYVTADDKPGVWFFSLDASNPVAVRVARWTYHLNYLDARMSTARTGDEVTYRSTRTHRGERPADFVARYGPKGEPFRAQPGTLEYFLTERYCLYAADPAGERVWRGDIAHAPWPLRPGWAAVESNTMAAPLGVSLPDGDPLLHFAEFLQVIAWRPTRVK